AWLDVNATLLIDASGAKVVVLGPRGAPQPLPTSLDGARVRARFRADRAGAWLVQVLATVARGPRPVLEAAVYAGGAAPNDLSEPPAPGESAAHASEATNALLEMINAARASEGLPALASRPELGRLAAEHAGNMRTTRRTAHDTGDGDLVARLA